MSFLGDVYRTGAGKSIGRSVADIRETLIDKPERRKQATEDRRLKREGQRLTMQEARNRLETYTKEEDKRERVERREIAEHTKWQEEQARLKERMSATKTFQSMTRHRLNAEHLEEIGNRLGLIDKDGISRAGVEEIWKYINDNVLESDRFASEALVANKKSLEDLYFLRDHASNKGKTEPSVGEESGSDRYARIMSETWRSAHYNKDIDPTHQKDLTITEIEDLIQLAEQEKSMVEKRAGIKQQRQIWMHKIIDGLIQEQQVVRGTELHKEMLQKEWKFGKAPVKPKWIQEQEKKRKKTTKEQTARLQIGIPTEIDQINKQITTLTADVKLTPEAKIEINDLNAHKRDLMDEMERLKFKLTPTKDKNAKPPVGLSGLTPDENTKLSRLLILWTKNSGLSREASKKIANDYKDPRSFLEFLEKWNKSWNKSETSTPQKLQKADKSKQKVKSAPIDYSAESAGVGALGKVERTKPVIARKRITE